MESNHLQLPYKSSIRPMNLPSMAPAVGFEPTALRLTVACSTVELRWNGQGSRSRTYDEGVQDPYVTVTIHPDGTPKWICTTDPLFRRQMLYLLSYRGLVLTDGFEPPTTSLSEKCSTPELSQLGTPRGIRTPTPFLAIGFKPIVSTVSP